MTSPILASGSHTMVLAMIRLMSLHAKLEVLHPYFSAISSRHSAKVYSLTVIYSRHQGLQYSWRGRRRHSYDRALSPPLRSPSILHRRAKPALAQLEIRAHPRARPIGHDTRHPRNGRHRFTFRQDGACVARQKDPVP
jgi:hypothetical protein